MDETTQPSGNPYPDARLADPSVVENVDTLVDTVRDLLAAEESRDQSFNSRGVGLAGFVGIIVSLTTTLGRDALKESPDGAWQMISIGLFAGALILLLATVVIVVSGVLAPRETAHLGYGEVAQYPLPTNLYQAKVMTQGRTLRGLVEVLGIERERGNRKARWLHVAYLTLVAGLVCIAVLGFILGLSESEVIPHGSGDPTELKLCVGGAPASLAATHGPVSVREACS